MQEKEVTLGARAALVSVVTRDRNEQEVRASLEELRRLLETAGGEAKFVESKHYPIVDNHPTVTEKIRIAAEKVVGKEGLLPKKTRGMGGEDFSYFANLKPGCMFRLGVSNAECGFGGMLHNGNLLLDEDSLEVGVNTFIQFVLDNMNGIDFNK